ncbi:MAG: DUF1499 domain-containing protein [Deltaproteobacteria bacterium]|nr:DUF1499 domain-containing protein [Deltaproteobacteria bacterium]
MIDTPTRTSPPVSVAVAAAGALLALGAVVAARLGWAAPYSAFRVFGLAIFTGGFLGLGTGLFALSRTWNDESPVQRRTAWAGTLMGAAMIFSLAMAGSSAAKVPPIHDLTTDLEDPPVFVQAADLPANRSRDLSYPHGDPETPSRQGDAYPDLHPIRLWLEPQEAYEACHQVLEQVGWTLTGTDESLGFLEATETSRIFRFVDDIVIRIRPHSNGGSVIDLRSTSRDGISDLGVNAERIRLFRDTLKAGQ